MGKATKTLDKVSKEKETKSELRKAALQKIKKANNLIKKDKIEKKDDEVEQMKTIIV